MNEISKIKKDELRKQLVQRIKDSSTPNGRLRPTKILGAFIRYFENFDNFDYGDDANYLKYQHINNYYNSSKRFINKNLVKYTIFNRETLFYNYIAWSVEYFIRSYKRNGFKNDKAFNKELRELKDLFKEFDYVTFK